MAVGDCGVVGTADLCGFCDERDEMIMGKWVDDDDGEQWVSDDARVWMGWKG